MIGSSSAMICWGDKILLFHRDNITTIPDPDCWHFPGGGVEDGETMLEGMKRELSEEVSYIPKSMTLLLELLNGDKRTNIYVSFVNDEEAVRFTLGPGEGQEIGFFTLVEMEKMKLTPRLSFLLAKFRKFIEEGLKTKDFSGLKNEFKRLGEVVLIP